MIVLALESRKVREGMTRSNAASVNPSGAAIEDVPDHADNDQRNNDDDADIERHDSSGGQKAWPMKGSIRPP